MVDLFHATVALPDSLSLENLTLSGTGNPLQDGGTFTLRSGATFTAAGESTANLGSASVVRARKPCSNLMRRRSSLA